MAQVLKLVNDLDGALPRLLVDSVVDYAIFVLDPDGNVASWNQGAERIKGWTEQQILGRHYSIFYTPEDIVRREPWRLLDQVEAEGRLAFEGWRVRKDGTTFWADVVMTALRDADGKLVGFGKVTRDLTERKNGADAERALAALQERERIARELHQGVIRSLFGIGLSLQAGTMQTSDEVLRTRLDAAIAELDDAISELRAHVFHPKPTD